VVGGNIGVPLISLIDDMQASQVVVAEISSFQLETVEQFKPWIGILLNISPDHRDRHPDLQEYISTKSLLFANQSCGDIAILNADDRHVAAVSTHPAVEVLRVSLSDSTADGKLDGQTLTIQLRGHNPVQLCHANEFAISGSHHQRNTLCASLAAAVCGARPEAITRAIRDYSPPRHLMEDAGTVNGVRFVNDSKATNPAAAMADWASIRGAVVLIAGGRSKEADLRQFAASAASRAKHIVLIGESAQSLSEAVGCQTPVTVAISMSQAVQAAFDAAEPGDTVLMAPGCASHDMFENMAARGEAFCREVTELARRFSF
jgi:UDP-N-acetylmuramoylalanine--D-glutamate ligase